MKYSEAKLDRIFTIRLEHGDRLPDAVEEFCAEKNINRAFCLFLGGIQKGGKIVAGPEENTRPPAPQIRELAGVHETLGAGTVFPDSSGRPVLHGHAAMGRGGNTLTGCIRPGITAWHVVEINLLEITGSGKRTRDEATGFELFNPEA